MEKIVLVGKPNCGKSLLFNRLTGLRQKVANYPGVTTQIKSGQNSDFEVIDYPGIYSLNALTEDENIAVRNFRAALNNDDVKLVAIVLDPLRLERSLSIGLKVQEEAKKANKSIVFVANMMDEVKQHKLRFNIQGLEKALGAPVLPVSARTEEGLKELVNEIKSEMKEPSKFETALPSDLNFISHARNLSHEFGPNSKDVIIRQNKLDRWVLSSFGGPLIFLATMVFLFQSIFTWASPLMDLVESIVGSAGEFVTANIPAGMLNDFLNDAIFGGFGSFLVFVPQIFILTFIIGILEDSGYLARAAVICHKPLNFFGLTGKSFIPLLSGHACAIPAMMVARNIESPKRRLLTLFAIPLMACSARLPVYALFIAAMIPPTTFLGGLIGYQGLVFFGLYFLGLFVAMLVTSILSKTVYKNEQDSPFVLEMPPYRLPNWQPLLRRSLNSAWNFVSKAGAVIFVVTLVVWVLGYFPNGADQLGTSYLAAIGQWIEPIFSPLGLDWKYGVAVLASFLAREVFVGTLGTLFGLEGADENIADFAANIDATGFTFASGAALLVFYAIALQCVSTVAVLRNEVGNNKIPVLVFAFYSVLAYALAYLTYLIFV